MVGWQDIADLDESERITMIGERAMQNPDERVGFVVDDDVKADRYIRALQQQFPMIHVLQRRPGPVATILVVVQRKAH